MISQLTRDSTLLLNKMPGSIIRVIKLSHVHILHYSLIRIIATMYIAHISLGTKSKSLSCSEWMSHFYLAPSVIYLLEGLLLMC